MKLTTFDAVMIAEGVIPPTNKQEWIDSWQLLLDDGIVWSLQGWFGRMAINLIDSGMIVESK